MDTKDILFIVLIAVVVLVVIIGVVLLIGKSKKSKKTSLETNNQNNNGGNIEQNNQGMGEQTVFNQILNNDENISNQQTPIPEPIPTITFGNPTMTPINNSETPQENNSNILASNIAEPAIIPTIEENTESQPINIVPNIVQSSEPVIIPTVNNVGNENNVVPTPVVEPQPVNPQPTEAINSNMNFAQPANTELQSIDTNSAPTNDLNVQSANTPQPVIIPAVEENTESQPINIVPNVVASPEPVNNVSNENNVVPTPVVEPQPVEAINPNMNFTQPVPDSQNINNQNM